MSVLADPSRRDLLRRLLRGAALAPLIALPLTRALAAEAPVLSVTDPAAKALKYTEDASKTQGIPPGNNCASCSLYLGKSSSTQGPCQIFPGKQVKAAGWCSSWAPQM